MPKDGAVPWIFSRSGKGVVDVCWPWAIVCAKHSLVRRFAIGKASGRPGPSANYALEDLLRGIAGEIQRGGYGVENDRVVRSRDRGVDDRRGHAAEENDGDQELVVRTTEV